LIYYGRYHSRRARRLVDVDRHSTFDMKQVSALLSLLPLDRLGAQLGQIIVTSLKEMLEPDVYIKLVDILENQAPTLLTSLLTHVHSAFRAPVRKSMINMAMPINKLAYQQASTNGSTISPLMQILRRSRT
jgi:L-fucose mutarotase/ribose pyranase (RbsD/FucU family)